MNFESGQKIYVYNSGIVEEWIFHQGYDGKNLITDGKLVYCVTNPELRKFHNSEHDCMNKILKKYKNIHKQSDEKLKFLNKEILTLEKDVVEMQEKIQKYKNDKIKLKKAVEDLLIDFKPIKEQYPEYFI